MILNHKQGPGDTETYTGLELCLKHRCHVSYGTDYGCLPEGLGRSLEMNFLKNSTRLRSKENCTLLAQLNQQKIL